MAIVYPAQMTANQYTMAIAYPAQMLIVYLAQMIAN